MRALYLARDQATLYDGPLGRSICPSVDRPVREKHTASGRHRLSEIPFPQCVSSEVLQEARAVAEREAISVFEQWLPGGPKPKGRPKQ